MIQPYYSHAGITIYHGDCRVILPEIAFAGVVVSDPPYGTGGWRRGSAGQGSNPSGGLVVEEWDDGAVDWLTLGDWPVITFWPSSRVLPLLQAAVTSGRTKHRAMYWSRKS